MGKNVKSLLNSDIICQAISIDQLCARCRECSAVLKNFYDVRVLLL